MDQERKRLDELIRAVRMVLLTTVGAACFGLWQRSFFAGLFSWILLWALFSIASAIEDRT